MEQPFPCSSSPLGAGMIRLGMDPLYTPIPLLSCMLRMCSHDPPHLPCQGADADDPSLPRASTVIAEENTPSPMMGCSWRMVQGISVLILESGIPELLSSPLDTALNVLWRPCPVPSSQHGAAQGPTRWGGQPREFVLVVPTGYVPASCFGFLESILQIVQVIGEQSTTNPHRSAQLNC